jgi:hypothetical protein
MKLRIYIDEVGNNDMGSSSEPNHRFLSLTGVVMDLDYVKTTFAPELEALKNKYFGTHPDDPIIFHRKELVNLKPPFAALHDADLHKAFNEELLAAYERWQYRLITVVIDKLEHQKKYNVWRYDPYHYCMAILFERYHLRLKEIGQIGDMMFESRGGKEDMRLKESYRGIFEKGTEYIKPNDIDDTLTSRELKIKPKSANIAGLQLADLLAFPARRYALKYYELVDDKRVTFNEPIIDIIKHKFYRSGNKLDGYGLKLLP